MRTTNLFQFGILALPTLALTYQVYIYVEYESRHGAKLSGQLYPDGRTHNKSFSNPGFVDSCSNSTSFLTLNRTGTECRDLHSYAGIATVIFEAGHSDSRHFDISMPGYDLSVCTRHTLTTIELTQQCNITITDQAEEAWKVVAWVIGSGLYTFEPAANLHRVGVDCFNVSKEA
jgi:hypothetical protein